MEDIFIVSEDLTNAAYRKAQEYADIYKDWRWGQCIFNAYYTFFPEESNKLRGTDDDCFYRNDKVEKFLSHFRVEQNIAIKYVCGFCGQEAKLS